jgi:hypothetical protein
VCVCLCVWCVCVSVCLVCMRVCVYAYLCVCVGGGGGAGDFPQSGGQRVCSHAPFVCVVVMVALCRFLMGSDFQHENSNEWFKNRELGARVWRWCSPVRAPSCPSTRWLVRVPTCRGADLRHPDLVFTPFPLAPINQWTS